MIRTLTAADTPAVAALHLGSLQGLLTRLGDPLATAFYRAAIRVPATIGLVADEGGPIGFVLGTQQADGYYRRVALASPFAVGARLAWRAVREPGLLRGQGEVEAIGPELLFFAVAAERRGEGLGGKLLGAFEDELRARGLRQYELTVEADNAAAIAVYEHRGLERTAEFEEFGLARRRYRKTLTDA